MKTDSLQALDRTGAADRLAADVAQALPASGLAGRARRPAEDAHTAADAARARMGDREDRPGREAPDGLSRHRGTGIEVQQVRFGGCGARFMFELVGVSSAALKPTRVRWSESGAVDLGESARQHAFAGLAASLQPDQRLRFIHQTFEDEDATLHYRMLIEGEAFARSEDAACILARDLLDSLHASLAMGAGQFGFVGLDRPLAPTAWIVHQELMPGSIEVEQPPAFSIAGRSVTPPRQILLPLMPKFNQTYLEGIVALLTSLCPPTRLVIEWRGLPPQEAHDKALEEVVSSLLDVSLGSARVTGGSTSARLSSRDLQLAHDALQRWMAEPVGALMRVWIQANAPLPASVGRAVGHAVFLGRPFVVREAVAADLQTTSAAGGAIDLRGLVAAGMPIPALMPDPLSADAQGIARRFPDINHRRSRSGIVLGHTAERGLDVRFADRGRGQHCLVLGQTGSGKTRGVIEAMALQDIARGDSVVHIDFDGDSFDYLLAACPPSRRADVVALDFTDFDASPGLNLLQYQTRWPRIERGFIVDNLIELFKQEYRENPEAFGPIFEQYLANAAFLVMQERGSTVVDIVRVFADPQYRNRLLGACADPSVRDFWNQIAHRAGGDMSVQNVTPYIVAKLTKLVDDELVRRVVGQPQSTIDLRAGMDARKVFLIKLSKGLLSERGARFLGMLLTSRLFVAALSRADIPADTRPPCYVYLDEFQNLLTPSIQGMLAESRKYGLRLTLSTQNLARLAPALAESVLTNCGSKIILRAGPRDAATLAPWVAPHFGEADLVSLPNRHAVVRLVTDGMLSPAFVMRTRTLADRDRSPATEARVTAIRAESRARYCVDAAAIDSGTDASPAPVDREPLPHVVRR